MATQRIALVLLPLYVLGFGGCAAMYGQLSPQQIHEVAKIKDAAGGCFRALYAGASITATWVSTDKGIPAGTEIKGEDCSLRSIVTPNPPRVPAPTQ